MCVFTSFVKLALTSVTSDVLTKRMAAHLRINVTQLQYVVSANSNTAAQNNTDHNVSLNNSLEARIKVKFSPSIKPVPDIMILFYCILITVFAFTFGVNHMLDFVSELCIYCSHGHRSTGHYNCKQKQLKRSDPDLRCSQ